MYVSFVSLSDSDTYLNAKQVDCTEKINISSSASVYLTVTSRLRLFCNTAFSSDYMLLTKAVCWSWSFAVQGTWLQWED